MKKKLTFEEAIRRLEEIVSLLGRGDATLEESLTLYGESAELMAFCKKTMDEAKLSIEEIFPEKEVPSEAL